MCPGIFHALYFVLAKCVAEPSRDPRAVLRSTPARMKEQELIDGFVQGASELLGVAFIIAISRGITVIMNSGFITDTILNWGEQALAYNP